MTKDQHRIENDILDARSEDDDLTWSDIHPLDLFDTHGMLAHEIEPEELEQVLEGRESLQLGFFRFDRVFSDNGVYGYQSDRAGEYIEFDVAAGAFRIQAVY